VIVPDTHKSAAPQDRGHAIELAVAFVAIYVIWGSTYLAIRYAVETIPPLVVAGIRHSIAGAIMLAWAWLRGFRPTRQQWIAGFVVGALFFLIGHGTLHWAEQYVASGLAALLIATEPMFILVLGWMLGQQKISRLSAMGLGLGVVGVAMLTGAELTVKGSSLVALFAVLLGSLSWSAGVVLSPKLNLPSDALGRTALPTICGAVMLLIAAGITGVPRDALEQHFHAVDPWIGISHHVWFSGGVHGLHVAAAAVSASPGGDAHICQSSGRSVSGMAAGLRAFDDESRARVRGDPGSDHADPPRRALCGEVPACSCAVKGRGKRSGEERIMISRLWHGWTTPEKADAYEELLKSEVLPGIHRVKGFKGAQLLRRNGKDEVEFVTLTLFDSLEAVREFAGEDYEVAVVPPEARNLLARFDPRSAHYETVFKTE